MMDDLTSAYTSAAKPRRCCTIDDIPFILSLAHDRYRPFDPGRTLVWLLECLRNPSMLLLRDDDAFLIASIATPSWHPKESGCHVIFLCAREGKHWQAVKMLRHSIEWAREKNCVDWWLSSETEYKIDAMAKRMGAKAEVLRYRLDLRDADG